MIGNTMVNIIEFIEKNENRFCIAVSMLLLLFEIATSTEHIAYYLPTVYTVICIIGIQRLFGHIFDNWIKKKWRPYPHASLFVKVVINGLKLVLLHYLSKGALTVFCLHFTIENIIRNKKGFLWTGAKRTIQKYPTSMGYVILFIIVFGNLLCFDKCKKILRSVLMRRNQDRSPLYEAAMQELELQDSDEDMPNIGQRGRRRGR
ncbi:uncharacterized protein LOC119672427 [Teleopsis dalmanni]|uniref:uncharacterized protein LOC119672427 n=1 Tax=Teleopsis dalmanni TaxID=139649 RepID=UPI0018CF5FB1|nr:uncharacterized protein LOC119672427 [Teleopsis dalmanni]